MNEQKLLRILITGVGGQGVLSASKMLGLCAGKAGYRVQSSAVHGMAQRGGVVETFVIIGERFSPIIDPGEADIIMGFEPVETLRALPRGSHDTFVISNDQPVVPFFCSFSGTDYPSTEYVFDQIKKRVRELLIVNANRLAMDAGSVLAMNMTMLGVLAGTGVLPFASDLLKKTIEQNTSSRFKEINLSAFESGHAYCRERSQT